jgi:hypothetical protein
VALSDYPPFTINWESGLKPKMLQALGNLAVVSAQAEELLHQIYWHHTGLNERTGPIVTDNLNPKRLAEDILKLAALDKSKANIHADLKILLTEFETLNTKRNHCLHWIWEGSQEVAPLPASVLFEPAKPLPYALKRPVYRQSGILSQEFSEEDVATYCRHFAWLTYRLRSHTFSDEQLRERRREAAAMGEFKSKTGEVVWSMAELFWPAPWLDKPLPPETRPSNPPDTPK